MRKYELNIYRKRKEMNKQTKKKCNEHRKQQRNIEDKKDKIDDVEK